MSSVDGQTVWESINRDENFQKIPQNLREAMRPYIEQLPTVLASLLNEPANINSIMKSVAVFLRYCQQNNYISSVVSQLPEKPGVNRYKVEDSLNRVYDEAIQMAEYMAVQDDILKKFAARGMSEVDTMKYLGLNDEAVTQHIAGKLTIGKLLEVNPMAFFQSVIQK